MNAKEFLESKDWLEDNKIIGGALFNAIALLLDEFANQNWTNVKDKLPSKFQHVDIVIPHISELTRVADVWFDGKAFYSTDGEGHRFKHERVVCWKSLPDLTNLKT